jgi:hypothetical protein
VEWNRLSALAELFSSIAILITLIYLAIQTQQNTDAVRAASRQAILASDVELLLNRANNGERMALWCEPDLSLADTISLEADMVAFMRIREHEWLQYQDGLLDDATWITYRDAIGGTLALPRRRAWWGRISASLFDREFVEYLNAYLAEIPESNATCEPRIQ